MSHQAGLHRLSCIYFSSPEMPTTRSETGAAKCTSPQHEAITKRRRLTESNLAPGTQCRDLDLVGESAQRPEEDRAIDGIRDRKDVDVYESKIPVAAW
ncbi:hypothetical protein K470DRAFT_100368 [Piedraia hortae CBS 480.64]|uniref:Uncharacterized protein n=1 Tax=Piedraia hortae CBS 480.64 TaxID=1314780 RepID=A0A6A7BWF2_9PEZI|nr:hypothetical protein K470DRAFT_100368 [Piedraia hortae CBS 480.64]